jgi:hypothetical protein
LHHNRIPALAVIITEKRPKSEPSFYSYKGDSELLLKYPNFDLLKFSDEELLASGEPLDLILYAVKCRTKAKNSEKKKFEHIKTIAKLILQSKWSDDDKRDVRGFAARIIDLQDQALSRQLTMDLKKFQDALLPERDLQKGGACKKGACKKATCKKATWMRRRPIRELAPGVWKSQAEKGRENNLEADRSLF